MTTTEQIRQLETEFQKHNQAKEFQSALECLNKILQIDPERISTIVAKSYLLRDMGKPQESIHVLDEGLKKKKDDRELLKTKAHLLEHALGKYEETLEVYNLILELSPHDGVMLSNRAIVWNKLKKYDRAIEDCTNALEYIPSLASAFGSRAFSYLLLGNLTQAVQDIEQSIKLNPKAPRAHFVRACILEQKQEFEQSLEAFEHYLTLGHADTHCVAEAKEYVQVVKRRIAKEKELQETENTVKYDLFLSHYQRTGGHFALLLKLLLREQNPNLSIFLDVDDLENIHSLKANIRNSENVVLLLTEGVLERRFVIEEISTALQLNKNIILVWDKERCAFPDASKVAISIRQVLDIKAIIWNAERVFREVAVSQIFQKSKLLPEASMKTLPEKTSTQEVLPAIESKLNDLTDKIINRLNQLEAKLESNSVRLEAVEKQGKEILELLRKPHT